MACTLVAGLILWAIANQVLGTREPWDSPNYGAFYAVAIALSAAFGYAFPERGWLWGTIIVFAQLPIMLIQSGAGPLIAVGILFLAVLALPAGLASAVSASFAARRAMR